MQLDADLVQLLRVVEAFAFCGADVAVCAAEGRGEGECVLQPREREAEQCADGYGDWGVELVERGLGNGGIEEAEEDVQKEKLYPFWKPIGRYTLRARRTNALGAGRVSWIAIARN